MKTFGCNKYSFMIQEVLFFLPGQVKAAKKETAKQFLQFQLGTGKL